MKISYLLLSLCLLTGCGALEMVQSVGTVAGANQPALSVDAQVGDKTLNVGDNDNSSTQIDDNEGVVTIASTKSDKSFGNTQRMIINEGPTLLWTLIMLLGWLLPSPNEIYREVKSWFNKTDTV